MCQLTTRLNAHISNLSGQRVDRASAGEKNPSQYPLAPKTAWHSCLGPAWKEPAVGTVPE